MTRIPEIKSRNPTIEDVEYLLNENEILSQEIMRLREERKKVWDALVDIYKARGKCSCLFDIARVIARQAIEEVGK